MDAERLLDGLNESQRRAVASEVVPLCILAGAGSGKTRVLTRRIAYRAATGAHDPRRVLALTFTRKAAGEMNARLRQLGLRDAVAAGTFHAVAYAQLRARWAERNVSPPALLDRKVGFVARLVPSSGPLRDLVPLDLVGEIEWAKARMVTPEGYPAAAKEAHRKPSLDYAKIAELYARYEDEKTKRRMVDFDDLLRLCRRELQRDPSFAAAQQWRHRHLFVDEYQDVNPLQQALLDVWLGDNTDFCVVGDPNQAIYGWNGADARYLVDFGERHRGSEIVRLEDNYRSSPQVLTVANAVLGGAPAARRAARRKEHVATALRPNRPDGPVPTMRSFPDERAEARAIARAVRDLHRPGAAWSSQAVLVRTNAQTVIIEKAMRATQVPCRVKGGDALLDQAEVKQALRAFDRPKASFEQALADLEVAARAAGAGTEADSGIGAAGGEAEAGWGAARDERQANLQALLSMAADYAALDGAPSASGFVAWLRETTGADRAERVGDAVEIATFHAAKGLEWPIVHLAGLEQGLIPIGYAQTPAELAEELRLFYVAVTRAERELHCTWAAERTFGTRAMSRERSPYLDQVEAACRALEKGAVPDDWAHWFAFDAEREPFSGFDVAADASAKAKRGRASKKGSGKAPPRTAGALSDLDPDAQKLFDALREWRTAQARVGKVSPFVILHDATLREIARVRPATMVALRSVSGIGPSKAERYGEAILAVVRDQT